MDSDAPNQTNPDAPVAASSIRPPPIKVEVFKSNGWTFICRKGPIWGEKDFDNFGGSLLAHAEVIDHCPDAFFGHNCLQFHYNGADGSSSQSVESDSPCCAKTFECRGCKWCFDVSPVEAANGMKLKDWDDHHCFPNNLNFQLKHFFVPGAEAWTAKVSSIKDELNTLGNFEALEPRYDWTCSSKYWGSVIVQPAQSSLPATSTLPSSSAAAESNVRIDDDGGASTAKQDRSSAPSIQTLNPDDISPIPFELISDTSIPILWFQQCDLFSDDLSDSGSNHTDVKLRVMPTFWFAAYRQLVRVDRVMLRCTDVRLFHLYGSNHVIRECIWKEADYDVLTKRMSLITKSSSEVSAAAVPSFDLLRTEDTVFRVVQSLALPPS